MNNSYTFALIAVSAAIIAVIFAIVVVVKTMINMGMF
jgi:hypothetical protein